MVRDGRAYVEKIAVRVRLIEHVLDILEDLPVFRFTRPERLFSLPEFDKHPVPLEGIVERAVQWAAVKPAFRQEVLRPPTHGLDSQLVVVLSGQNDNGDLRRQCVYLIEGREALSVRQPEVQQDD